MEASASAIGIVDRVLAQAGKRVHDCIESNGALHVQAHSIVRVAPCPSCRSWSRRQHACYWRRLAERPVLDKPLVLSVEIRRFKVSV